MDDLIAKMDREWPQLRDRILKQWEEKGTVADMITLPPDVYEALYEQGRGHYAVENYDQAEKTFNALMIYKGDDVRAWLGYAGACEAQEKWNEAALGYAMAMGLVPGDPVPAYRAGICLMKLDQIERAREVFGLAAGVKESVAGDPKRLPYAQRAQSMLDMIDQKLNA